MKNNKKEGKLEKKGEGKAETTKEEPPQQEDQVGDILDCSRRSRMSPALPVLVEDRARKCKIFLDASAHGRKYEKERKVVSSTAQ